MLSKSVKFMMFAILMMAISITTFAQSNASTGQITGVVVDSNGAVVPNTTVTLTSKDTNSVKTATTSDDGLYRFVLLTPGDYTVKANAANFGEQTLNITVFVGRTIDGNFTLNAGSVKAEEVTVTAEGVQTTTSNFDSVQTNESIQNLPINGRKFQDFATLTPTAQVDPSRGQISLSGQRGINGNINVDGLDFSQPFFGGIRGGERSNAAPTLPQESVREFQVVAAGYSAEFGRSSGGIINVVTKGGTNNLRGSAFWVYRPDRLARANSFAKALSEQRLSRIVVNGVTGVDATLAPDQHQFGGSIGGPIVKDKLFFFGSYEQQRFRAPRQILYSNLLTVVTPTPVQTDAFNFFRGQEVQYQATNDAKVALGKIDWNLNTANRLSTRYNFSDNNALNAVSTGETALDPTTNQSLSTNGTEKNRNNGIVANLVSTLSSNAINEFRFQFAKETRPRIANANVANINTTIGIYGSRNFLPTTQFDKRTQFADSLTYIAGSHTLKFGGEFSNIYANQKFGFNQFGVYSFAGLTATTGILDALSPVRDTTTSPTAPYYGRFDRTTSRYTQQIGNLEAAYTVKEIAFFAQDAWRISPSLTLNYGLRFEQQRNPSAEVGNTTIINLVKNTSFPILGNKGIDPTIIPDSGNQWGPRLGFAWDPKGDGKTVVRGFTGVYYARTPLLGLAGPVNNFRTVPGDLSVQFGSPAFTAVAPNTTTNPGNVNVFNASGFITANPQYATITGLTPAFCAVPANFNACVPNTVYRQFAVLGINLNGASLGSLPTITPTQLQTITSAIIASTNLPNANLGAFQNAAFTGITNDFKNPRSFQFGGGVEREIMNGITIGLDYSQINTVYLQRNRDINLPSPVSLEEYLRANNTPAVFAAIDPNVYNQNRVYIGIVKPNYIPTSVLIGGVSTPVVAAVRARPIASLGAIQLRDSSARSLYRALTFRINTIRKWGRINAFYTLSKSTSDDDNERDAGGVLYDNPYDLRNEYGLSNLDRRHQFVANPSFNLPFGFELSSAVRIRSGRPFESRVGTDLNGDGLSNERPFLVPGVENKRNYFINRPLFDIDVRAQKSFALGEGRKLSFSAEFFNVLNRSNLQFSGTTTTNYCAVINQRCGLDGITNSSFKQYNNQSGEFVNKLNLAGLNPGSQVFQMQLGARFYF
jgi:Carboxypeptidase regulatory-like domain